MLQFETVMATGNPALDSGIGDTALKTFNGDTYLFTVTGPAGGVAAWRLVDGTIPQLVDTEIHDASITFLVDRTGVPVDLAGQSLLSLDVRTATGLMGYALNPDGTIGSLTETEGLVGGGDVSAVTQVSLGVSDVLVLAHEQTAQISTYTINTDGTLSVTGQMAGRSDMMQVLSSGTQQFVISADTAGNAVSAYQVDAVTGTLSAIDNSAAIGTLGIATPTAVEVVQAYGQSWVVVAGSSSNTLSVLKLAIDGRLIPTDHVLDTRETRFGSVQDVSVVEVDGRAFVVAGGGDDGLTLFTLSPDGQLIHLDSFADTLDSGLQNVQSISVAHVGTNLQVFATSQQEAGVTQLTVSLGNLGTVQEGFGTVTGTAFDDMLSGSVLESTLLGGAGDDILIAGSAATTMTGGAGTDIFVMQYGSAPAVITDFQAGIDRLDLFDYVMLRTPDQLGFTATAQGAQITYLDETIQVNSATGNPLSLQDIFGAEFGGPDHVPVSFDDFSGLEPDSSGGVQGQISVNSEAANPALSDAEIRFTPDGGGTVSAFADAEGRFDLDLPPGSFPGELDIIKTYSTASGAITALDALQVLRLSVGLEPTWGPAAPENLIAADVTQDGAINALDALAILQTVVGQTPSHKPEWVFLDAAADLSGIARNDVTYNTGMDVVAVDGVIEVDMTSILLGNLEAV